MGSTVLVVDDDEDTRRGLSELLTEAGYAVSTVGSAGEAFDSLLQRGEPSVMLLDLMMPGKTGVEFLEELRGDAKLARIPVVVVTSMPELMREIQADALLKKPIDPTELLRLVEAFAPRS